MGQFIFFALLIITLLAGAYSYFAPSQKPMSPVKFMMESSGYDSVEALNHKQSEELNITNNKGLVQIRVHMDDIAKEQSKFLDAIQDQQQVLNNTGKDAYDIMLAAQQQGEKGGKDLLQLKALASQMQDEQNLLISHGQDLIVLNNELTKNRQLIADQIDAAGINTDTSLNMLKQRYEMFQDQATGFFDKVSQHNQEVHDQMDQMQGHLHDLTNNAVYHNAMQQQSVKDHVQRLLDKEQDDMAKLADCEEKNKELLKDAKDRLEDSKELLNDALQQKKDIIEEQQQIAQDQQLISQQRMADQMQRMQDRQEQQNH